MEDHDKLYRPGAWLRLKDDLGLGSDPFNDQLATEELVELNEELKDRIAALQAGYR